jgi:hypothetical protein
MKKALVAAVVFVAVIGTGGGVANAAPGPTPDGGLIGACNMTNAKATPGMLNAENRISAANANGITGMIIAIGHTDPTAVAPTYCPNPTP